MIALSFIGEFTVKNGQAKQMVLVFRQWAILLFSKEEIQHRKEKVQMFTSQHGEETY